MRRLALAGGMSALVVLALTGVWAQAAATQVRLCHSTGSQSFVVIEMSPSGAYHAHYPHHSDIIPPFQYQGASYSRNWDANGQATWNNGCVPPPPGGSGSGSGSGTPPPQVHPKAVPGDPSVTG
jgi:hypothetical protein